MTDRDPGTKPLEREARLRALEVARSVAFRHIAARLRGDLVRLLGCKLTAADAIGGRIELEALDERGAQSFADLRAPEDAGRRSWFQLIEVAALLARRKGPRLSNGAADPDGAR